jgi:hydrogenase-4 component E
MSATVIVTAALGAPGLATVQLLDLLGGGILLTAVLILWRRELAAIVRLLAIQGALIAGLAALLGASEGGAEPYLVALGVLVLKAFVLPAVLRRVLADSGEVRETEPLVNVTASLLAAALLTLLAYVVSQPLVALAPSAATRALPVGVAVVLLGFFVLVTRRRALSQVVGFLLLDNGITTTAFLAASGVPLVVELGVSLDVLLVVLVLQILAARMRLTFGGTDLDELNELRD